MATTILMVSWRDTLDPEAGGSERYIERVASGLVANGYRVTILCRRHRNAPGRQLVDGVEFVRRGNRYTVYLRALLTVFLSRPDVVVDVQNGVPFFSRLVTRCPVVLLVHHLHRLQWHSWFGPVLGRLGWWVESQIAPLVYRHCPYVTVSENTRRELVELGVAESRIAIVPNGLDPVPVTVSARSEQPLLVAVSRLVPHKRLEHAVETVAALRDRWPALRLEIVGRGPSMEPLRLLASRLGVADRVVLRGWVDERGKHELLARSWVHLCPSVKEGWGIAVMEAAAHGVPSVAYRSAGGVCESILDGQTGLLADGLDDFIARVDDLLSNHDLRTAMGRTARQYAESFDWSRSVAEFESLLREATGTRPARARLSRQRRGAVSPAQR
jgi:glycosyltransferase involved in cell wall biosynthesis